MIPKVVILFSMLPLPRRHRGSVPRAPHALLIGLLALACQMNAGDGVAAGSLERVPIGDIDWYVDYEAAVEVAREQDKALWVHFGENPG